MLRRVSQGVVAGVVGLALAAALGSRAGLVSVPLRRPDGAAFWTLSRAAGVTAYLALTATVAFGLLVSTGVFDRWIARARSVEAHRFLSALMLSLTGLHGAALLLDPHVRFDVLDVAVPFLSPYRPIAVGIGIVSAYVFAAIHASFALRARLGQRAWRAVHLLAFPAFGLVTAHVLLAGSDARATGLRATYLACAWLVLSLTMYRALALSAPAAASRRRD